MYKQFKLLLITLGLGLYGCSSTGDDGALSGYKDDYTTARMAKQLEVPQEIGTDNSQDLFIVPDIMPGVEGDVYGQDAEVLAPMQILSLGSDVRTNKSSQTASAFINKSEIAVWDIVNQFMLQDNVAVSSSDIGDATIETDWVTNYEPAFWGDDEPVSRHKYSVKLLDSQRPNETRLDVVVIAAQNYVEDSGWQSYIDTNRAGAEFINQILGYMYVEDIKTSRTRVSQSALGGITVNLGSDQDGNPALVTSSDFQQTWDRVPIAMYLLNMQVDDKDRSNGLYFLTRKDNDDGFFESLAFWSDDDGEALDLPKGNYRLQVINDGPKTYIIFTDSDDVPLTADILARNFALLSKAFKAKVSDGEIN